MDSHGVKGAGTPVVGVWGFLTKANVIA
jgi:hypothetical protein